MQAPEHSSLPTEQLEHPPDHWGTHSFSWRMLSEGHLGEQATEPFCHVPFSQAQAYPPRPRKQDPTLPKEEFLRHPLCQGP